MRIISMGEVLWDIFDQQELLGGAPLNFSASLQRLGHAVSLVTGVGTDTRGKATLARLKELGLSTEFVQSIPGRETGTARVTLDWEGQASFVIPRPAAFDSLMIDEELLQRIAALRGEWLYFGTLSQTAESNLQLLLAIVQSTPSIQGFYDMNLREGHWNLPRVQQLSAMAKVLKLNETEAETLFHLVYPQDAFSLQHFCSRWSSDYDIDIVCVTLGGEGCALFCDGTLEKFFGYHVEVADTVGAGDAFAAAFLHGLSRPGSMKHKAAFANALGALVASRAGATPEWSIEECLELLSRNESPTLRNEM